MRVCRESAALLPSSKMMSVPHPLPPPHVSLTPPYVQLTGWIRELLAANQLTLAQIKALRKPLRVVSAAAATRGGAPTRVHRVECIIYPVTNYSPAEEEEEKRMRPKVAVSGRLVRQEQGSELVLLSVGKKGNGEAVCNLLRKVLGETRTTQASSVEGIVSLDEYFVRRLDKI